MLKLVFVTIFLSITSKYVITAFVGIGVEPHENPHSNAEVKQVNPPEALKTNTNEVPNTAKKTDVEKHVNDTPNQSKYKTEQNDTKVANSKDTETQKKETSEKSTISSNIPKSYSKDLLQSGALLRGFYVFLGLSAAAVFYFVYRSYRLRHGSQVSTTVKKYGITARRSDLEMRHLELDDDEDDTLFEINQNINR